LTSMHASYMVVEGANDGIVEWEKVHP
jgi:hypothetical protein